MSRKFVSDVAGLIRKLDYYANHNRGKQYIVHQRTVYGNVPLWVTTKVLTFGQLSKFYRVLQFKEQSRISKAYENVSEKSLDRYLNALTLFRNVCAHNERLFSHTITQMEFPDTPLHRKMNLSQKGCQYTQGKKDYFGLVIALRYMLQRSEFLTYKRELRRLIDSYCKKSQRLTKEGLLGKMGMPMHWETITRYRL